jgi:uncharacterized membrane protein
VADSNGKTVKSGRFSALGLLLVTLIIVGGIFSAILGATQENFITSVENIVIVLLNVAINALYLLGAGMVTLGSILVTIRYVKAKMIDPSKPFVGVPRARYLTLSLEFFIGAEIIKTVVVRTYEEFLLLIFVIISRGLFSLILYLDRRWHGAEDTK